MKYVIGNWKMNLGIRESVALARAVLRILRGREYVPEIVLCPAFTALYEVHKVLSRGRAKLGAQNCGPDSFGAYTGEISAAMLADVGCQYVILGHSERREIFVETNEIIRRRLLCALHERLTPIVCVGESLSAREAGKAFEYVEAQIKSIFADLPLPKKQKIFIAYEPIWAIGTGVNASISDTVEMHQRIRQAIKQCSKVSDQQLMVIYGGSVDDDNARDFLREREVDGVLVGGASIKPRQFETIIKIASDIIEIQKI